MSNSLKAAITRPAFSGSGSSHKSKKLCGFVPSCEKKRKLLVDSDDLNDWQITFSIDLAQAKEDGKPSLVLLSIAPVVETPSPSE